MGSRARRSFMNEKNVDSTVWLSSLTSKSPFVVQFRDDPVHVTLGKGFKVGPGQQFEFWDEIRKVCVEHGSRRLLVEGSLPSGERQTSEVIEAGQRTTTVPNLWLAFHIENFVPTEQSELYQVIAASRGVRVKFFADAEHALAWLRHNSPA